MKKIAVFTLLASLMIFTACQDPIYEAIREDVKPEEATVSGNIGFVTRYTANDTEFLVLAADDGLRYKQKDKGSHGEWNTFSIPFGLHSYDFDSSSHSGEQIVAVLANSNTLYMISAVYAHTSTEGLSYPSNIKLWGRQISANGNKWNSEGKWTLITENNSTLFPIGVYSDTGYYGTNFGVFQTNAPMAAHRAAFIWVYNSETKGYRYYKLDGLEVPSEITIENTAIYDPEPSSNANYIPCARSAAYFNGEIKFCTSPIATTNETYSEEATYFYYTNSNNKLYFNNGTAASFIEADSDYVISSLAVTADSILIGYGSMKSGSAGGIDRATLTAGVPVKLANFSTNAQFQITRSYIVLTLLNATPEKKETDSDLYAAITFSGTSANFDNIGLWSYYPSRGSHGWNRE